MATPFIQNIAALSRVLFARLRFVAVFIVAALVVGYWDNIKNHVDKWTRPAVAPDALAASHAGETEFFCPMHPDVIRDEAGSCPKCGMPLVKRLKGQAVRLPDDVMARVQLTPKRVALGGIGTTAVVYKPLEREVRAVGVLDYDETKVARLTARVTGRVDELFAAYTGASIRRGDAIYSLYSPEVYTAQREYLLARKRANDLAKDAPADARADASAVYNASLEKLALWGMSAEQLAKLDADYDRTGHVPTDLTVTSPISGIVVKKDVNQGQYLNVGDAPYIVADLSDLWLQMKLYEADVPLVNVADPVQVTVEALPGTTFDGIVAFKAFQLDPDTRTLDARVVVDNAKLRLRPGMFADATIRVPIASALRDVSDMPPTTAPMYSAGDTSKAYAAALGTYLEAQKRLAADKADGVAELIGDSVLALRAAKDCDAASARLPQLEETAKHMQGQPLESLRDSFKSVSQAMIDIGKSTGLPADAPPARVFKCPMKDALWIQPGEATANPYYGSQMLTCGSAVDELPRSSREAPTTRPAHGEAARVLAVPRSAVIETGKDTVVYVEEPVAGGMGDPSARSGIFDMKAVTLGPIAGEFYPVLSGLKEGDQVVTAGTFLIDAENRLNPTMRADAK
jgi:multidrug efflux pump subunit AcrA (membrane-fusion protein)